MRAKFGTVGLALCLAACGGREQRSRDDSHGMGGTQSSGGSFGGESFGGESFGGAPASVVPEHWGDPLDCTDTRGLTAPDDHEIPLPSPNDQLLVTVPRDDDSILGLDAQSHAVTIGLDGTTERISLDALYASAGSDVGTLSVTWLGRAIFATHGVRVAVLDLSNGNVGAFEPDVGENQRVTSSSSGRLLVEQLGAAGTNPFTPDRVLVRALDTEIIATLTPLGSLSTVPAGDDTLVDAVDHELVGVAFDGTERFRYDLGAPIESFVAAAAANRFVAVADTSARWVDAGSGEMGAEVPFAWHNGRIALSPDGSHAALAPRNDATSVTFLENGLVSDAHETKVAASLSLEVNDKGTLAVAGLDADGNSRFELSAKDGMSLLVCTGSGVLGHPYVTMTPDGRYAVAVYPDRVRYFELP